MHVYARVETLCSLKTEYLRICGLLYCHLAVSSEGLTRQKGIPSMVHGKSCSARSRSHFTLSPSLSPHAHALKYTLIHSAASVFIPIESICQQTMDFTLIKQASTVLLCQGFGRPITRKFPVPLCYYTVPPKVRKSQNEDKIKRHEPSKAIQVQRVARSIVLKGGMN